MTLTRITKDKIESSSYNNILHFLDNRTYIADPKNRGVGVPFIHDSDPLSKSINFTGYPYIVFKHALPTYSNTTVDGKHKLVGWKHTIIVRSAKNGSK